MAKMVAIDFMTLDGVVQAPAYPEEDTDGGFRHGGWHLGFFDDVSRNWAVEGVARAGGFVFGRRTYENMAAYWPHAPAAEQALAGPLNSLPKYVASTTLTEPLAWSNSTLLDGDVVEAVAALKDGDGGDLNVLGSTRLVRTLLEHDLLDEFRLMIDPVVVGGGKRLFPEDAALRRLRLLDTRVTSTGAIIATWSRAS